jgi:2-polyprenyl-3-methyl-5-hydroxy-6-metoxy-1,4-benzoquinol methylase
MMAAIMTTTPLSDDEAKQRDELVGRVFGAFIGALDLASVYLGDKLGLYAALVTAPATSTDLARRAGISERYAREWLEQQAVTGILTVDNASADADARVYALPRGHAEALLDRDSPASATPMAIFLEPIGRMLPRLVTAYRTGEGIPWSEYGDDTWQGQGDFNRPTLRSQFAHDQLPKVADVHAKLQAGARVADVACGVGWAAIGIAQAYPNVHVDGFDLDESAIAQARETARADGVADRVTFHVADAAALSGSYDVATIIEAVHDMSHPVEVLRSVRTALAKDGILLVADENVSDTFTAPGNDVERLLYGASLTFCLPNGLADRPSAATGAIMRPATMRRYAIAAGFTQVEELPLELGLLRFYRMRMR